MKQQIIRGALLCVSLTSFLGWTACSDDTLDEINKDRNHPTAVSSNFIITHIETSTAFSITGGDFNSYLAVCLEHEAGAAEQMFNTDHRYVSMEEPSSFGNQWAEAYTVLADCKDIISICSEGGAEEGNLVNRGIAKTIMAYNLALITDLFGDVPWTEALDFVTYMSPTLDKQETIYNDVFALLDEALADLGSGSKSTVGNADVYYGGDVSLWTKAVYALKARYTMRLLGRAADRTSALNNVLSYIDKSFTSAAEEMKLDHYDAATMFNPTYVFCRSRDLNGLSKSLMDKFITRNDPRANQVAVNTSYELITPDDAAYNPIPNGTGDKMQGVYSQAATNWSETAPTQLLSYHELLFLKAEAQARLGQDASVTLRNAVAVSFENLAVSLRAAISSTFKNKVSGSVTLSSEAGGAYFDAVGAARYAAHPLQEVMVEKYLAFFGASGESVEAFSDYRRLTYLNEPFIELANPNNAASTDYPKGHFPLRLAYGSGDTTTNPHIAEAQGDGSFVYSEPVWWAGGTR
ncbi:MAG: SusD/RagB family nutrient-binding outer membrane lipoprotein [Tannerellaceae bacterium]|jgi:hypothetical protein|nr:SusD/RagB family nutrient-binding outer membrane lipoprotein [Tannerellaceae bacterium]